MDLVSEPGLSLTVYAAEPASPTAQALALLASWAATELGGTRSPRAGRPEPPAHHQ